MKSIDKLTKNEYIINKSRFITYLVPINSIDEIENNFKKVKIEYKDATHHCYAYILDNVKRFSDDGEPGGTAGMPILNVLEQNELNHILCIVVRYFGGIKLGAGGLVRAYTNSVSECIECSNIIELINGVQIEITFNYDNVKQIDYILKDYEIVNKRYEENIIYLFNSPTNTDIKEKLNNYVIKFEEKENILIKN